MGVEDPHQEVRGHSLLDPNLCHGKQSCFERNEKVRAGGDTMSSLWIKETNIRFEKTLFVIKFLLLCGTEKYLRY